jgi:hypothetical protein
VLLQPDRPSYTGLRLQSHRRLPAGKATSGSRRSCCSPVFDLLVLPDVFGCFWFCRNCPYPASAAGALALFRGVPLHVCSQTGHPTRECVPRAIGGCRRARPPPAIVFGCFLNSFRLLLNLFLVASETVVGCFCFCRRCPCPVPRGALALRFAARKLLWEFSYEPGTPVNRFNFAG